MAITRRQAANSKVNNSSKSTKIKNVEDEGTTPSKLFVKHRIKTVLAFIWKYLKYTIIILLIPPFLNYAALQQENRFLKLPGLQYDIGRGQKLHLYCRGKGSPTVILEAPTGTNSDIWYRIQREISKVTTVCSYDRAGLGFSQRPYVNYSDNEVTRYEPFTIERMAFDLHQLITSSSQQPKPFVIVGSDLGAAVARFYAQMFEEHVASIVLISPLVEDLQLNSYWNNYWFNKVLYHQQLLQISAVTGLSRIALLLNLMKLPMSPLNIEMERRYKHLICQPRHLASGVDEIALFNTSMNQMDSAFKIKPFSKDIKLFVIENENINRDLSQANKAAIQRMVLRHQNVTHVKVDTDNIIENNPGIILKHINLAIQHAKQFKMQTDTNFRTK